MSPHCSTHRSRNRLHDPVPSVLVACLSLAVLVGCASTGSGNTADQTRAGVRAADQGYWEEAEFRWLKALAISTADPRALNNLAVRFERDGEFADAKAHYDRALQRAGADERFYIERNYDQFRPIWERIQSGDMEEEEGADESASANQATAEVPTPGVGIQSLEILISVPDQGPNLAGFNRLLVGDFLPFDDSESNLNDFAVRYFRRRITQRTFFETRDELGSPIEPELRSAALFENKAFWVNRAATSGADLILTGQLGLNTREESRMVRERIRSPDGQIREVARFQDSVIYSIKYDYVVLRGEDGELLLEGSLEGETPFPVDEGVSNDEAVFETLEQLLPSILEVITPRRSEQSRYLIY